jgi:hypothetical protein
LFGRLAAGVLAFILLWLFVQYLLSRRTRDPQAA